MAPRRRLLSSSINDQRKSCRSALRPLLVYVLYRRFITEVLPAYQDVLTLKVRSRYETFALASP